MAPKGNRIKELLQRGVEEIIPPTEDFGKVLSGKKKLTVYLGIDPTASNLHLGHSVNLLKLKKFQELGHKTILLIGDFTARIGDPSGKTSQRSPLTAKQVKDNLKAYKKQAGKILDFKKVEIRFNSEWLLRLRFEDVLYIASAFTVNRMLQRDMFQERLKSGNPIGLDEFLYPIMQGYDSVALKTDVEIGGSDQLFNMLVGRDLVKKHLGKEKYVLTTKLLVTSESGAKMSKSEGVVVALNDASNDMYAKVMAFSDSATRDCFELCTEIPMGEVDGIMKLSPREAKARLAREIVAMYHSRAAAQEVEREFKKVFSEGELPSDIPTKKINKKKINILDLLTGTGLVESKSEARRVVEQGGVKIDGRVVNDYEEKIDVKSGMVVQVGKRRFVKLK